MTATIVNRVVFQGGLAPLVKFIEAFGGTPFP